MPYRKPDTGLWKLLLDDILNLKQDRIDMKESFYCGDAAGRKKKPFNDHSSDDLIFSINLRLKFYTPEMFFLNKPINFKPLQGTILDSTI